MRRDSFGVSFDLLALDDVVRCLAEQMAKPECECRFVVTPNVDHVVALVNNDRFEEAYRRAELRVVDGWPVSVALRWLHGVKVPVVPGSDLVPALFDEYERRKVGLRVFLLGAAPGVAEVAARRMSERWSTVQVTGTCSPDFGFENDPIACQSICDLIAASSPDLLVVGLGAPKQEIWVSENAWRIHAKVAVCAGATIDFLSGNKKRAPYWVRNLRLEWAFRMVQEPRRLMKRYVKGVILFPVLVLREKFLRRHALQEETR